MNFAKAEKGLFYPSLRVSDSSDSSKSLYYEVFVLVEVVIHNIGWINLHARLLGQAKYCWLTILLCLLSFNSKITLRQ